MTADSQNRYDNGFLIGVLAGTAIGAGLAMWLLPQATAELRDRATASARQLRTLASDQYRKAAANIEEAVAVVNDTAADVKS